MNDLDQDLIDAENALLRSARLDDHAVPREAHRRILAGLGITAALSAVTTAASGTVGGVVASSAAGVTILGILQWTAVGATAGALMLGAAHQLQPHAPAVPALTSTPRALIDEPRPPRGVDAPPALPEEPPSDTTPVATAALPPRDRSPVPPPATDRTKALAAEVESLDRVRRLLAAGDAPAALTLLDAHQLTFPEGHLTPEAMYLRVQVLLKTGNRPAAIDLARRFIASFPRGPQAPALRDLAFEQDRPRAP